MAAKAAGRDSVHAKRGASLSLKQQFKNVNAKLQKFSPRRPSWLYGDFAMGEFPAREYLRKINLFRSSPFKGIQITPDKKILAEELSIAVDQNTHCLLGRTLCYRGDHVVLSSSRAGRVGFAIPPSHDILQLKKKNGWGRARPININESWPTREGLYQKQRNPNCANR